MSPNATTFAPAAFRALKDNIRPVRVDAAERAAWGRHAALNPAALPRPSGELSFREVIVPLDGSPHAEHALPWALQIATLAGAPVRLLHIHQRMQPAFHGRRLELYREFDRLLREPMEEYVAEVARRIRRASDVAVTPSIVEGRNVADTLSGLASSTDDIVVMATRGRTVASRTLVGSSLDAIVHNRPAPILHVRGYSCPVDLTARPSLRHSLVPLECVDSGAEVLRSVAALSNLTDGRQTLLRVVESPGAFSCGDGSSHEAASELEDNPVAHLDEVARTWRDELPHARTSVVWSDDSLAREILTQAEEREVDFIAMSTRRRSRLSRLLRPGVFDQLLRRAKTPILVVKRGG